VGDKVLVKLQPYRQHSIVLRKNQKLSLRYFGPFEIIEKIGTVAYKLLLPESAKIYLVFHVSLLKPFRGDHSQPYFPLLLTTNEFGLVMRPHKILDTRMVTKNGKLVSEVLVQWDSALEQDNSWEQTKEMKRAYPHFNLEDKVAFIGGSNVTNNEASKNKENEVVIRNGHVSTNEMGKDVRKSDRAQKENTKWKYYV